MPSSHHFSQIVCFAHLWLRYFYHKSSEAGKNNKKLNLKIIFQFYLRDKAQDTWNFDRKKKKIRASEKVFYLPLTYVHKNMRKQKAESLSGWISVRKMTMSVVQQVPSFAT